MPHEDEHTKRMKAFLALLRWAEQGGRDVSEPYRSLYGNGHFADLGHHPDKKITRWGHTSTAAGAYGITYETYKEAVRHGIAHNFHEQSQDAIAVSMIRHASAEWAIWDGRLDEAFVLLNRQWSSLPGGSQHELTAEEARAYFWKVLGEAPN